MKLTMRNDVTPPAVGILFRENDLYLQLAEVMRAAVQELGLPVAFEAKYPKGSSADESAVTAWAESNIPNGDQKKHTVVIVDRTMSQAKQLRYAEIADLDDACDAAVYKALHINTSVQNSDSIREWEQINLLGLGLFKHAVQKYMELYGKNPQVVIIKEYLLDHIKAPDHRKDAKSYDDQEANYKLLADKITGWLMDAGVPENNIIFQVNAWDKIPGLSQDTPVWFIKDRHNNTSDLRELEKEFPYSQLLDLPMANLLMSVRKYGYLNGNDEAFTGALVDEIQNRVLLTLFSVLENNGELYIASSFEGSCKYQSNEIEVSREEVHIRFKKFLEEYFSDQDETIKEVAESMLSHAETNMFDK